jgi:SAM-dependent methyltransferase
MNAITRLVEASTSTDDNPPIEWLIRHVARNRFLPVPPPELHNVGDGDYRAIGAEFLGHFVRFGGLRPTDHVLDIGCGTGRMAMPMTQFLDPKVSRYEGFDVAAGGVAWCKKAISTRYPNFRFQHIDVFDELYNPKGKVPAGPIRLPFEDRSFDFVLMTSVVTHLTTAGVRAYVNEIGRLLRPSARCFLSLFLMDDVAREHLRTGPARLSFDPNGRGPEHYADPKVPTAAVAYDTEFLLEIFAAAGLVPARPIAYGHWSGRLGDSYQDLCVLTKGRAE